MFELPKSTEFSKRIPKKKFYEKLQVNPEIKKGFNGIKTVVWKHKLSSDTINLEKGSDVQELQIFEIKLNQKSVNEKVLKQIDKHIPYHILYLLEFEDEWQAWITYKESSSGKNAFTVGKYYHTDWLKRENLPLQLEGLNLDTVYENFVKQVAGDELKTGNQKRQENLKEIISKADEIKKMEKKIEVLQKKIKREKQLNKQIEMNGQLKKLRKELEEIRNGKDEDGIR